ncbi:hypothetical protein V5799_022735 [Amblyomma americanum]|uniref:Uncharacterized protein n=1 Tax=Amblyomma americanum TaxID=6943 RepID=A0AAQ4FJX1_AMBAM
MSDDDDENMQAELTRRVTRGGVSTRTTTKGGKKTKTKKEGELTMMRTGNLTQGKKGAGAKKGAAGKGAGSSKGFLANYSIFQRCFLYGYVILTDGNKSYFALQERKNSTMLASSRPFKMDAFFRRFMQHFKSFSATVNAGRGFKTAQPRDHRRPKVVHEPLVLKTRL